MAPRPFHTIEDGKIHTARPGPKDDVVTPPRDPLAKIAFGEGAVFDDRKRDGEGDTATVAFAPKKFIPKMWGGSYPIPEDELVGSTSGGKVVSDIDARKTKQLVKDGIQLGFDLYDQPLQLRLNTLKLSIDDLMNFGLDLGTNPLESTFD